MTRARKRPAAARLALLTLPLLFSIQSHAGEAAALGEAWRAARAGRLPADAKPLAALAASTPAGLLTENLLSAATALAGLAEEGAGFFPGSEGETELFATPWGRALAAQGRLEASDDALPLIKPFFSNVLAGVKPERGAVEQFLSFCSRRYHVDLGARLAEDAGRGMPSEELRAWIGRYLRDQRRLSAARRLFSQLAALEKETPLVLELAKFEAGAPAPSPAPAQAAGGPVLTSGGLHLQAPTRLGRHERGDEISLSGGYWVDGLPEGRSAQIEETTFLEYAVGAAAAKTERVRRTNGGPYTFSRRLILTDSQPFLFRSIVRTAGGQEVSEGVIVRPAADFDEASAALAAARQRLAACAPKEVDFHALEAGLAPAAKAKPQYAALLKDAEDARRQAERDAATLARLEELISESRADASPQRCLYRLQLTEEALRLARGLPPGCGRYVPDLEAQRAAISRRAADQEAFAEAARNSRSRASKCDFSGSADLAAGALAILQADPAARCGGIETSAAALEDELARSLTAQAWRQRLSEEAAAAEKLAPGPERLAGVRRVLARVDSLASASCEGSLRRGAAALAEKDGAALTGPDARDALPLDYHLAKTEGEVMRERQRPEQLLAPGWASASERAPAVAAAAPPPEAPAPAAEPAVQPPAPPAPSRGRPKIRPKKMRTRATR